MIRFRRHWPDVVIVAMLAALLAGCRMPDPNWAPPVGSSGVYRRILVVPIIADTVNIVRQGEFFPPLIIQSAGWDTPVAAANMVHDLLAPVGTDVVTAFPAALPMPGFADANWPEIVWGRLAAQGYLDGAEAILLLHQNPINNMGTECNLLTALTLGRPCTDDPNFQAAFIVVQNVGLDQMISGQDPRCLIGLDARLLEARTGRVIGVRNGIVGRQNRPSGLAVANRMTESEREVLRPYCLSALRHAISIGVGELPLIRAGSVGAGARNSR